MRIALAIHALHGGGAERVLARLARRWSSVGHNVHFITWAAADSDEIPLPPEVERHGLNLMRSSSNPIQGAWANILRVHALRRTFRRLRPDLILSFCDQMNVSTLQAARGLEVPVWISEHSDPSRQRLSRAWEWWRRTNYPRCTGCIVLTQEIAAHMERWIPRSRLKVIPNAVDAIEGIAIKNTSQSIVLSVGRLSPEKGIDQLLHAWRQVQAELRDWELRIVGDGPQRASLQSQAAQLSRVQFAGWMRDPSQAYQDASLFVLPSRYEGFPVALLEAMSHGLPCIATRCSQAVEELSRDGQAVRLVSTESPEALAKALLELTADFQRRQQLGANAQCVSRQYSWNQVGPLWDALLHPT